MVHLGRKTCLDAKERPQQSQRPHQSQQQPQQQHNINVIPWKQALYETCQKQQSLWATPYQILQNVSPMAMFTPRYHDQVILVPTLHSFSRAEWLESIVNELVLQGPAGTALSFTFRNLASRVLLGVLTRVVLRVRWTAVKLYHIALGDDDDDYDYDNQGSNWVNANDNHPNWPKDISCSHQHTILCMELLKECLDALQDAIEKYDHPFPLYLTGTGPQSFVAWCRQGRQSVHSEQQLVSETQENPHISALLPLYLSIMECNLLAELITKMGWAVWDQDHDLIVLSPARSSLLSEIAPQVQVAIALFQLKDVIHQSQRNINGWCQMLLDCTQNAKEYKRGGDAKSGLWELKKRKLLQDKIQDTKASLLNLHQMQLTLESANQVVDQVTALQASTNTLKQLREKIPNLEDIHQQLQHEMDEMQSITHVLASMADSVENTADGDEALLLELTKLTLNDTVPTIIEPQESLDEPDQQQEEDINHDQHVILNHHQQQQHSLSSQPMRSTTNQMTSEVCPEARKVLMSSS